MYLFARRAHTVNYIVARNKVVHHLFNGVDIVLEVGVEAYHGVSVFFAVISPASRAF